MLKLPDLSAYITTLISMPNKPHKNNKANKQARAQRSFNFERVLDRQLDIVKRTMEQTVAPDYGDPMVFPAPAPSRAGSARFPKVIDIKATATQKDFGVMIRPTLEDPILVTSTTAPVASALPKRGLFTIEAMKVASHEVDFDGSIVLGEDLDGILSGFSASNNKYWIPILNVSGAPTLDFQIRMDRGGNWVDSTVIQVYTVNDVGTKAAFGAPLTFTGFNITGSTGAIGLGATIRYYGFEILSSTSPASFEYDLVVAGGDISCGSTVAQNIMAPHSFDWDNLLGNSKRWRIAALDCTLTYTGQSLLNSGVVAVANVDSSISPIVGDAGCSYYRALVERPYDEYHGRLAPEGEADGGAHWYYLPDDVDHLTMDSLSSNSSLDIPAGVFGVEGMADGASFILSINVIVNYYSEKPEYRMEIQPPMTLYNIGLSLVRRHVGIVSSNDSHTNKLKKVLSKGGSLLGSTVEKAFKEVRDNPERYAALALSLL